MVKLSRSLLAGVGAGSSGTVAPGGIGSGSTLGLEPIGTDWEFDVGGADVGSAFTDVSPAVAGVEEPPDARACLSDARSAAPATLA